MGPGDRVVLMMRNVPAFHFIDLGIAALGATAISIYNSSSPEQVAYLAGHCQAKVALVEDDGFEERFLKVRDELPELETIVNLSHDGVPEEIFHGGTVDLARGVEGVHARHAGHGDLHVGHHRAAEGRDDHATATWCGRPRATCGCSTWSRWASGRSRTCRWRTSPSACRPTTSR